MSNEEGLSAEVKLCDRADNHGKHGWCHHAHGVARSAAKVLHEVQTRAPPGGRTENALANRRP
jgi:hypothetical protein